MFKIMTTCKGGGYRYCRTEPPHPKRNAKGLYPLHRVIVENKLGRLLARDEDVHHIDGNKDNNDPSNLEALERGEHTKKHRPVIEPVKVVCQCGASFTVKSHIYRQRLQRSISGKLYCSIKCELLRVRGEVPCHPHKVENAGSNPAPATT